MSLEKVSDSAVKRPQSESDSKSSSNESSLGQFAESAAFAYAAPALGLLQLAGQDVSAVKVKHDGSFSDTVGNVLGSAALYTTAVTALKFIPGVGGVAASVAAGALMGFLNPTEQGQGLDTRLGNMAVGSGLMLGLGSAQAGLAKLGEATAAARGQLAMASEERANMLGTSFNPKLSLMSNLDSLLPKSALGQVLTTNAALGAAYTQLDSRINTGDWAGLGDTAAGAGMFAAVGGAAHGIGKAFSGKPNLSEASKGSESPKFESAPAQQPPEATQRPARQWLWTDLKAAASGKNIPLLDEGLKLDHQDEIPTFVQNYFNLDTQAAGKFDEAIRNGKVQPGTENAWKQAVENTIAARRELEGPLAAARAGDGQAQANIDALNRSLEQLTAEAKATGKEPTLYAQQKLSDPALIATFAWQRFENEGASALREMKAASNAGVIQPGSEGAWKSAQAQLEAYRKDLQASLQDRYSLSDDVERRLPSRSANRLIAELQERSDQRFQSDPLQRPGLGFVQSGLDTLRKQDEEQALVRYMFDKYPAIAPGFLQKEVERAFPPSRGGSYTWNQVIQAAQEVRYPRTPLSTPELIDQLKDAARNRPEDYLNLGLRTLTNGQEISEFVDHYMEAHPHTAKFNIQQAMEYGYVAQGSEGAWQAALKQNREWTKFAAALPESQRAETRAAFDAWQKTRIDPQQVQQLVWRLDSTARDAGAQSDEPSRYIGTATRVLRDEDPIHTLVNQAFNQFPDSAERSLRDGVAAAGLQQRTSTLWNQAIDQRLAWNRIRAVMTPEQQQAFDRGVAALTT